MPRTYDDPCGLARALDLVGERWALLVVRELLLGPKRFAELRRGLPLVSQSVLTARLGGLEAAGAVRHRRLGPPAGTSVYELTERGRELEPALLALAAWGSRAPLTSSADLSVDALVLALRTTFDAAAARGLDVRCAVRLPDDVLRVTVRESRLEITRDEDDDEVDAVLETTAAGLRELTFGGVPLGRDEGLALVRGDRERVARLLGLFRRPTPATVQG